MLINENSRGAFKFRKAVNEKVINEILTFYMINQFALRE